MDLLHDPVVEHCDALSERHRLDLVVGDVERRHREPLVEPHELRSHLDPELRVEVGERLVHEEAARMPHDRAPHGHPLSLAARERPRLAVEEALEAEQCRSLLDPPLALRLRDALRLEREADVRAHRHMRVERVVLEHHCDVTVDRVEVVDDHVADEDLAGGGTFEAGQHAQCRRLAAARRPHEDHELAVRDLEVEVVDGDRSVGKLLRHTAELDRGHLLHPVQAHRRVVQLDSEPRPVGHGEPAVLQREGLPEDPVDER